MLQELRDRLFGHLGLSLAFYTATAAERFQSQAGRRRRAVCRRRSPRRRRRSSATSSRWSRRWWRCWCSAAADGDLARGHADVRSVQPAGSDARGGALGAMRRPRLRRCRPITQERSVSGSCWPRCFGARRTRSTAAGSRRGSGRAAGWPGDGRAASFFAVTRRFFGMSPALVYLVAGLQGTHGDLSAGSWWRSRPCRAGC